MCALPTDPYGKQPHLCFDCLNSSRICSGSQRYALSVPPKSVTKPSPAPARGHCPKCPVLFPPHSHPDQVPKTRLCVFCGVFSSCSISSLSQAHLVLLALFCSLFRLCVLASQAWQDHSAAFSFVLKVPLGNPIQALPAQS